MKFLISNYFRCEETRYVICCSRA